MPRKKAAPDVWPNEHPVEHAAAARKGWVTRRRAKLQGRQAMYYDMAEGMGHAPKTSVNFAQTYGKDDSGKRNMNEARAREKSQGAVAKTLAQQDTPAALAQERANLHPEVVDHRAKRVQAQYLADQLDKAIRAEKANHGYTRDKKTQQWVQTGPGPNLRRIADLEKRRRRALDEHTKHERLGHAAYEKHHAAALKEERKAVKKLPERRAQVIDRKAEYTQLETTNEERMLARQSEKVRDAERAMAKAQGHAMTPAQRDAAKKATAKFYQARDAEILRLRSAASGAVDQPSAKKRTRKAAK